MVSTRVFQARSGEPGEVQGAGGGLGPWSLFIHFDAPRVTTYTTRNAPLRARMMTVFIIMMSSTAGAR